MTVSDLFSPGALQKHVDAALKDVPHAKQHVEVRYRTKDNTLVVSYAARFQNGWILGASLSADMKADNICGEIAVSRSW